MLRAHTLLSTMHRRVLLLIWKLFWILKYYQLVRYQLIGGVVLALDLSPSFVHQNHRRITLQRLLVLSNPLVSIISTRSACADTDTVVPSLQIPSFQSKAYGRQEYTNSITASRDTNLSPAEAYDVIRQRIPSAYDSNAIVLDLGAGAGVSTTVLAREKNYRRIDAVDWSRTAWDNAVVSEENNDSISGVQFYEMDDDSFFNSKVNSQSTDQRYDAIVYNFAINLEKAQYVAIDFLRKDRESVLLAPVNDRTDYWYKQSYVLLNNRGEVLWTSSPEVGAWSIQFQPDVTSPTCTGIWCGSVNGFSVKIQ